MAATSPPGDGLAEGLSAAHDELREIACGIHPVALAKGGLVPRSPVWPAGLKDRVETLGGRIWLDSPLGTGTRVKVELPFAE